MTNREAIDEIRLRAEIYEKYCKEYPKYHDALVMAITALEKQDAKSPIWKYGRTYIAPPDCGGAEADEYGDVPYCPCCGKEIDSLKDMSLCHWCGQRLNWEVEDTE